MQSVFADRCVSYSLHFVRNTDRISTFPSRNVIWSICRQRND